MKTILTIIIICFFALNCAKAQEGRKIRKEFSRGTILSATEGRFDDPHYFESTKAYDELVFGIATGNSEPRRKSDLIWTDGIGFIRYNSENGSINKGDPVTSSSEPGVAMKATQSGMMLGVALESTSSPSGLIKVRVLIQYVRY